MKEEPDQGLSTLAGMSVDLSSGLGSVLTGPATLGGAEVTESKLWLESSTKPVVCGLGSWDLSFWAVSDHKFLGLREG